MQTIVRLAKHYPVLLGCSIVLAIFQMLTWFGLAKNITYYDTGVHFLFSVLIAQLVYIALVDFKLLGPDKHSRRSDLLSPARTILLIIFVGTTIGAWWEIVEFCIDHIFGAHLQKGNVDTMTDLIADSVGSLVGAISYLLLAKFRSPGR